MLIIGTITISLRGGDPPGWIPMITKETKEKNIFLITPLTGVLWVSFLSHFFVFAKLACVGCSEMETWSKWFLWWRRYRLYWANRWGTCHALGRVLVEWLQAFCHATVASCMVSTRGMKLRTNCTAGLTMLIFFKPKDTKMRAAHFERGSKPVPDPLSQTHFSGILNAFSYHWRILKRLEIAGFHIDIPGLVWGGHAPHSEDDFIFKPNVLVAHFADGIEVHLDCKY